MSIKIQSVSRDMVGDQATVRAEIHEQRAGFTRVMDTIEIEITGGARMREEEIITRIREIYNG